MPVKIRFLPIAIIAVSSVIHPAIAENCHRPPGTGTRAETWGTGRVSDRYLTTSGGRRYPCGEDQQVTNNPKRIGGMNLHERVCGPLTILRENHYMACPLEYRPGNKPDGGWTPLDEFRYRYFCISPGYIILSKHSIRDKRGSLFALTALLRDKWGMPESSAAKKCTSKSMTITNSTKYRVGDADKFVEYVEIFFYPARMVAEPLL
jgi:hypothetical protein